MKNQEQKSEMDIVREKTYAIADPAAFLEAVDVQGPIVGYLLIRDMPTMMAKKFSKMEKSDALHVQFDFMKKASKREWDKYNSSAMMKDVYEQTGVVEQRLVATIRLITDHLGVDLDALVTKAQEEQKLKAEKAKAKEIVKPVSDAVGVTDEELDVVIDDMSRVKKVKPLAAVTEKGKNE